MGGTALSDSGEPHPDQPYLLDTHVWLWYVAGSDRLPPNLRGVIDAAIGQLWISPMSVWEIAMLHARGRVDLRGGPRRWVEAAMRGFPLQEAALTSDVALRSQELDLGHRDPADYLLAATALVHGLILITLDERLVAADWLPTLSA